MLLYFVVNSSQYRAIHAESIQFSTNIRNAFLPILLLNRRADFFFKIFHESENLPILDDSWVE